MRFRNIAPLIFAVMCATAGLSSSASAADLQVLPGDFTLTGPLAWQQLVVEQVNEGQFTGQVRDGLSFESSDPKIVRIEDGEARPVADGAATITAKTNDGASAQIKVTVKEMTAPAEWSFRNHVESVLSKSGCNAGACHGALAGKNGFKLSLLGYDPEGDHTLITRGARGRRVVPSDPGRSLFLTKPSGGVPHKGGVRFKIHSREYNVLADWIAAGAPTPTERDPRLERLELLPPNVILKPGMEQQLLLRAHFTDGHTEDVTRWARFTSANESVAQIDDKGNVKIVGHGEGALTAWYLSKVVISSVSSPYEQQVPSDLFANAPKRNFIDGIVLEKLESLNLPPSPRSDDSEFIRRAFLDTMGTLPTPEETLAFLNDAAPDKRDKLIEALLDRPEFVDYWAYKWSDMLLVNSVALKPPAVWSFYSWIKNQVQANTPWDQFARKIITAKGSTLENGGANYFVLHKDPSDMAETTTVAFLGMSINCAKCHNHPLEKWTNNQYFAFANHFARVRVKQGESADDLTVFASATGDLIQPLTGKPQAPAPLDAEPMPLGAPTDRRDYLADWLTSPENPYFARSVTNRVWANFFGVGLVEMVDDMRLTNPPSNEKLLAAASDHLVKNKFDLKALMRTILQSETYQRGSAPLEQNKEDARYYSRYYPRRLMAEVMLDAISQVTASPTKFNGYPEGWRAIQLPDSNVDSYFLETFGRPDRTATCSCERTAEPSMVQVLHISNGSALNAKLQAKNNIIDKLVKDKATDDKIVETAYLTALARRPTEKESAQLVEVLAKSPAAEKRAAIEDIFWSILSSREFLFNH